MKPKPVTMRQLVEFIQCRDRALQHRRSLAWLGPVFAGFFTHDIAVLGTKDSWTAAGVGIAALAVAAFYSFQNYRRFERRWALTLAKDVARAVAADMYAYLRNLEHELFAELAEQEAQLPRSAGQWPEFLEQGRARMALARKKGAQGDTQEDCSGT